VSSHRVDVVIFAIAFAVFGLVALALVWSGDWAYAMLARFNGVRTVEFVRTGPTSLDQLLFYHRTWAGYVIRGSDLPPGQFVPMIFTTEELAHMTDVQGVFRGAELAAVLALGVCVFRLVRTHRDGSALRVLRTGSLAAAALVAAVGIVAVFAFDALFLLFHEVFFPQGNFLFDSATSNLVRLYPEWYWQGITAGVAISFIALALLAAVAPHLALRRASTTYTRAA